jgi:inositol phosphorylceramide mannosyltransferase catalytic subunit
VIPRVFHQIWLGDDPFPYERERATWQQHHPSWEHRLWTEADVPADLELKEAANRLRQPAERADILRLELLHRHGGVYLDADFECLKPIDPLLDGVDCFLGLLDSGRVSNAVIGCVPGHPLLARAMAEVRPRETYGPVDREGTGPLLLERLRHEVDGVTVFPANVFYATERAQAEYAFHLSARSWKDASGLREDVARAERDRASARDELTELQRKHDLAMQELEAMRMGRSGLGFYLRRVAIPRKAMQRARRKLGR